jgi:glucose/arabinose dehydrogenase
LSYIVWVATLRHSKRVLTALALIAVLTAAVVGIVRTAPEKSASFPLEAPLRSGWFDGYPLVVGEAAAPITDIRPIRGRPEVLIAAKNGELFVLSASGFTPWLAMEKRWPGHLNFRKDEQGFLSFDFHPQFPTINKLFVSYTARPPASIVAKVPQASNLVMEEWSLSLDGDAPFSEAEVVDRRELFSLPMPSSFHFGGHVRFGPDGALYFSTGDGTLVRPPLLTAVVLPQSLYGAVLRFDLAAPNLLPVSNPFFSREGVQLVWAYGFRNPWRFAFAPDGKVFLGDVGNVTYEEVNHVEAGQFYGWPFFEGVPCRGLDANYPPERCVQSSVAHRPPIFQYGRTKGVAVIMGEVYEGSFFPQLKGKLLFSDHAPSLLWAMDVQSRKRSQWTVREIGRLPGGVTCLGAGTDGEILVGSISGYVHRMLPAAHATNFKKD